MSKQNLIVAYNKLIDEANKAKSAGKLSAYLLATEEAKFVMELIKETEQV